MKREQQLTTRRTLSRTHLPLIKSGLDRKERRFDELLRIGCDEALPLIASRSVVRLALLAQRPCAHARTHPFTQPTSELTRMSCYRTPTN